MTSPSDFCEIMASAKKSAFGSEHFSEMLSPPKSKASPPISPKSLARSKYHDVALLVPRFLRNPGPGSYFSRFFEILRISSNLLFVLEFSEIVPISSNSSDSRQGCDFCEILQPARYLLF